MNKDLFVYHYIIHDVEKIGSLKISQDVKMVYKLCFIHMMDY